MAERIRPGLWWWVHDVTGILLVCSVAVTFLPLSHGADLERRGRLLAATRRADP